MAETIASMAVRIGVDLKGFTKDMDEFRKTWSRVGSQVQQVGSQIGTAFTAAGAAITAGLGVSVKAAMDFDKDMSRVGAIAGATETEFESMRQTALNLGASTSKSASEVAKGMELMATKGYDANQVMAAMPGVIAAAEASGEDMALTADTVASALNAFQMEAKDASRVADVLAMSANTSAAGITDLQYAFKYAAPVAKALDISMEQLAAATGIMADNGMRGEQAGTTLRAALLRLTDPPKEAANQLRELGVSVTDASGKFLPFDQIIGQLRTSTDNMSNSQKAAALSTIFGTEAMTGMLSLVEAGPEKFNALTEGLINSGGASAETAALMKDNLAGSMEELGGAVETLQISLGSALAPAIRAVTEAVTGVVNWFNQLSPATQRNIAIAAALTAGLLVLVGVVGFLAAAIGTLMTVSWAVIAPIAGIIAIITAVIAAVVALTVIIVKNWEEIKAFTTSTWETIKQALQTAWDWIVGLFTKVWETIKPIVSTGWEAIKALFTTYFGAVKAIVSSSWEAIKTIFSTVFLAIYYLVTGQWNKIGELFRTAGEKLRGIVSGLWEKLKEIFSGGFTKVTQSASEGWKNIKTAFSNGWEAVKKFMSNFGTQAYNIGKNIMEGMVNGIKSMVSRLADQAKAAVQSAVDAAKNFLGINSPSKLFMQFGEWTGEGFAIGLEDSERMVANATTSMITTPESIQSPTLPNVANVGASAAPTTVILELDGKVIAQSTINRMGGMFRTRGAVT